MHLYCVSCIYLLLLGLTSISLERMWKIMIGRFKKKKKKRGLAAVGTKKTKQKWNPRKKYVWRDIQLNVSAWGNKDLEALIDK